MRILKVARDELLERYNVWVVFQTQCLGVAVALAYTLVRGIRCVCASVAHFGVKDALDLVVPALRLPESAKRKDSNL